MIKHRIHYRIYEQVYETSRNQLSIQLKRQVWNIVEWEQVQDVYLRVGWQTKQQVMDDYHE